MAAEASLEAARSLAWTTASTRLRRLAFWLRLLFEETGTKPSASAVGAKTSLVREGFLVIVGVASSPVTEVTEGEKLPLLGRRAAKTLGAFGGVGKPLAEGGGARRTTEA